MAFGKKLEQNPIEKYMYELRLSRMFDGYGMANGVSIDPYASKEILKAEMRRVEEYLAAKEEIKLSRKLR